MTMDRGMTWRLGFLIAVVLAYSGTRPARAADQPHFACGTGSSRAFYDAPTGKDCVRLSGINGFVDLLSDTNVLVSFSPSSVTRDGDTIQVLVNLTLATPAGDVKGQFQYNALRAKYQLFCKTNQQLLMQGTYRLGNTTVYQRQPGEAFVEPVAPDTVSDALLHYFCGPPPAAASRGAG